MWNCSNAMAWNMTRGICGDPPPRPGRNVEMIRHPGALPPANVRPPSGLERRHFRTGSGLDSATNDDRVAKRKSFPPNGLFARGGRNKISP